MTPKKSNMAGGCLITVGLVIVAAVSCGILSSQGGSDNTPTEYAARQQCQRWVEDQLKSPSTADFSETVSTGGPTSWTFRGVVDAENSFGAAVRASWTCTIRSDGDMWRGNATLNE